MQPLPLNLSWSLVVLGLLIVFVLNRAARHYASLRTLSFLPGMTFAFSPFSIPGALLPTSNYNPGMMFNWGWRHTMYKNSPMDMMRISGVLAGRSVLYTNS
ncbi:hypothetical protein DACRYDRAFT_17856 [Dacryopinax primogenitus]|uniref:Uncharacterized protein n=1 Tax=Dacryopinax primogenitus (strain DJM 731) TaxID=1858805 RepID=M5FPM3_DACPD|nr:uncharacterized protein DACRYDRAFT_17856 [Dacryopinax primogenitus]EJT98660.1 hypothetical protein DACRYDRAFT_17856 [Dacryopinax primogenitus]